MSRPPVCAGRKNGARAAGRRASRPVPLLYTRGRVSVHLLPCAAIAAFVVLSAREKENEFLARNSVAVAPAFAHCTNRCTRRKVTVTARSTKQENRKMKKRSQDENTILKNTIPARGSSTHPEQMGGKEKKGRAEWLRITGSILTPESSKN